MTNDNTISFADIHNHMLFGIDDGAQTEPEMTQLIDASYADGVRCLCFTPHYHPGYFGKNLERIATSFDRAEQYAAERYPDLCLFLGNELRYERSWTNWLEHGSCRTLNSTDYLLVDFLYSESAENIMDAMLRVLNAGYKPVLAHVERYEKFHRSFVEIERLKSWGVVLQVDAQSPLGGLGRGSKIRSRKLLDAYLIDLIASDAHDLSQRPPQLSACYDYVSNRCGKEYADDLFWNNPLHILDGKEL